MTSQGMMTTHVFIAGIGVTADVQCLNDDHNTYDLDTWSTPQFHEIALEKTDEWVQSLKDDLITQIVEMEDDPDIEHDWQWREEYRAHQDMGDLGIRYEAWAYELTCGALGDPNEVFGLVVVQRHPIRVPLKPIDGRKTLEQLAKETQFEIWGTDRQIKAQNAFCDALKAVLSPEEWEDFESYAHKATTEELVAEGMRLARKHA